MERDGKTLYTADKPNPLRRRFEISGEGRKGMLEADFGRTMTFRGNKDSHTMAPRHPFTRKAIITRRESDLVLTAFTFWLTVLTWKRSANAAASS